MFKSYSQFNSKFSILEFAVDLLLFSHSTLLEKLNSLFDLFSSLNNANVKVSNPNTTNISANDTLELLKYIYDAFLIYITDH